MDRISALRNVEEALAAFEAGEDDLAAAERRVITVLRTYATEYDGEDGMDVYQSRGGDGVEGVVVVAGSPAEAEGRIDDILADAGVEGDFDVERL